MTRTNEVAPAGAEPSVRARRAGAASTSRTALSDLAVLGLLAVTWTVAVVATLAVARWTSLGPVVMALSHNHGIHLGDVLAGFALALAALGATVYLLQRLSR